MPRDPKKINSYAIIDFETGGLDRKDQLHAKKYPVTEFGGLAINGVTLEKIIQYDNLVKPYDNDLLYDKEAARITGITKELCEWEGVPLKELVEDLCTFFKEANLHNSRTALPICLSHNWPFDGPFLQDLFRRANVDLSKYVRGFKDCYGNFMPHGICSIDLAKECWGDVTDTDTKYDLTACCSRAGIEVADGHRAMNDVLPLTDLVRYFFTRSRSGSSEVKVVDGVATSHRATFEW